MRIVAWIGAVLMCTSLEAQAIQPADSATPPASGTPTVRIVPAAQYKAGWLRRRFSGSLWRNVWTAPLEVPVLDLNTYAGGLVPTRRLDSTQSKVLLFRGEDGHHYRFRSLDRDFKMALPPDLRQSFVYETSRDMVSSANPLAPVMASLFLEAIDVLHSTPHLTVLPNDERLGAYQADFAGTLGTLDDDRATGQDVRSDLGSDLNMISTTELLERLEQNNDDVLDAESFLKIRLLDIYLGDWSRDRDGWLWMHVEEAGQWIWKPMAHDYDWAFARYNGLFPWAMTKLIPQVSSFGSEFPRISNLVWEGQDVDQRILVSLDKPRWDSLTAVVVAALSDSLIEQAVSLLPPVVHADGEDSLEKDLKSRRAELHLASESYYELLSSHVNIRASERAERAEIRRLNDHAVEVGMYRKDGDSGTTAQRPLYRRVFEDTCTKDVRLFLMGGDDEAVVEGDVTQSISVRVVGGDGNDRLVDHSSVKGKPRSNALGARHPETQTRFYDSDAGTIFVAGPGTGVDRQATTSPLPGSEQSGPPVRDWGLAWKYEPWVGINSDDGFSVGSGVILYKYGFRADPYVYRMQLRGQFLSGPQKFRGQYAADFLQLLQGTHVFVNLTVSQRDIDNYYGAGNESTRDQQVEEAGGYEVEQKKLYFRSLVEVAAFRKARLLLGASVKNVYARGEGHVVLDTASVSGEGSTWMCSADAEIYMETRDHPLLPTRGVMLHLQGSYDPGAFNHTVPFGKARAEARAYVAKTIVLPATLALRVAGERVWGAYPFYEGAIIGGTWTVRGFDRNRFTGNASVIGNAELRLLLARPRFPAYGVMGISFSGDVGRVFAAGEDSQLWHPSVGAGVWSSFIKPAYTFSVSVARSVEETTLQTYVGFMF